MTILSDRQIIERCSIPTHYVADVVFEDNPTNKVRCVHSVIENVSVDSKGVLFTTERLEDLKRRYLSSIAQADDPFVKTFSPMIAPFADESVRKIGELKVISYGVSSYGYDVKLAPDFQIFTNVNSVVIDPKRFDERCLVAGVIHQDEDGSQYVILPPNSYILGHTVERFQIPADIMCICVGKSTYARAGAIVNVTPIEPGFAGQVVIEISNSTPSPLKIYANEGIAQFMFFQGSEPCRVSYADRSGKYQNQSGIHLPTV